MKTVGELKKGDFFTKKPIDYPTERQVWVRGEYCRGAKVYECHRFDDINDVQYFKPSKTAYVEFTF